MAQGVHDTGDPFARSARPRFTADHISTLLDLSLLDGDGRFELIDGEIVEMAADYAPHSVMKSQVARWLGRALGDDVMVGAEVTIKLGESTLLVPDVAVWRPFETTRFLPASVVLLAVEVASKSVVSALDKVALYANSGVPEVWIIDLAEQVTHVRRAPIDGAYSIRSVAPFGDHLPPTLGLPAGPSLAALGRAHRG